MATTSFPHNSTPSVNRGVAEAGWRRFGRVMLQPGVVQNVQGSVEASAAGGTRIVDVATGEVFIDGFILRVDEPVPLFIAAADPIDDRIDRVVVRYDPEGFAVAPAPSGTVTLEVLEGVPDAYPVPPTLTQTVDGIFELPVAQVVVQGGVAFLDPADIVDERVFVSQFRDLQGSTAERLAFVPSAIGVWWFDTDLDRILRWDGTQWVDTIDVTGIAQELAVFVDAAEDAAAAAEDAAIVFAIALGG